MVKATIQKSVKIRVDNPIMPYATLRVYGIDCKRWGNYVIVSEGDFQLAQSLVEEWKI